MERQQASLAGWGFPTPPEGMQGKGEEWIVKREKENMREKALTSPGHVVHLW